jgi:hypothetical protein
LFKTGVLISLRRLFAVLEVKTRNRDLTTTDAKGALGGILSLGWLMGSHALTTYLLSIVMAAAGTWWVVLPDKVCGLASGHEGKAEANASDARWS